MSDETLSCLYTTTSLVQNLCNIQLHPCEKSTSNCLENLHQAKEALCTDSCTLFHLIQTKDSNSENVSEADYLLLCYP